MGPSNMNFSVQCISSVASAKKVLNRACNPAPKSEYRILSVLTTFPIKKK